MAGGSFLTTLWNTKFVKCRKHTNGGEWSYFLLFLGWMFCSERRQDGHLHWQEELIIVKGGTAYQIVLFRYDGLPCEMVPKAAAEITRGCATAICPLRSCIGAIRAAIQRDNILIT